MIVKIDFYRKHIFIMNDRQVIFVLNSTSVSYGGYYSTLRVFLLLFVLNGSVFAESFIPVKHSTWSVVLYVPESGELIAASSSKYFNVIHRICRVKDGVGLVISKARGDPKYFAALDYMEKGMTPSQALQTILKEDISSKPSEPGSNSRQVVVVDYSGSIAVHTGKDTAAYSGHITNTSLNYVVLGNGLESSEVLEKMDAALKKTSGDSWAKIEAAMRAAVEAGGEVRPENSAGICYAGAKKEDSHFNNRGEFISVADSPDPVRELFRLMKLERSRIELERAFSFFEQGMIDQGFLHFNKAKELNDKDAEILLWQGYFSYKTSLHDQALKILAKGLKDSHPWGARMLERFGGEKGKEILAAFPNFGAAVSNPGKKQSPETKDQ